MLYPVQILWEWNDLFQVFPYHLNVNAILSCECYIITQRERDLNWGQHWVGRIGQYEYTCLLFLSCAINSSALPLLGSCRSCSLNLLNCCNRGRWSFEREILKRVKVLSIAMLFSWDLQSSCNKGIILVVKLSEYPKRLLPKFCCHFFGFLNPGFFQRLDNAIQWLNSYRNLPSELISV